MRIRNISTAGSGNLVWSVQLTLSGKASHTVTIFPLDLGHPETPIS